MGLPFNFLNNRANYVEVDQAQGRVPTTAELNARHIIPEPKNDEKNNGLVASIITKLTESSTASTDSTKELGEQIATLTKAVQDSEALSRELLVKVATSTGESAATLTRIANAAN